MYIAFKFMIKFITFKYFYTLYYKVHEHKAYLTVELILNEISYSKIYARA